VERAQANAKGSWSLATGFFKQLDAADGFKAYDIKYIRTSSIDPVDRSGCCGRYAQSLQPDGVYVVPRHQLLR